jgi:hypothetical protein
MPFGLKNVRANFKRAMDVAFLDFIEIFLAVYEDELITYNKKEEEDQYMHLDIFFCQHNRMWSIFDSQKLCVWVKEGKFLGHIVFKEGIRIELERFSTIEKIPQPKNVKGIQSFFGHINFLRRFVNKFKEITCPISEMLNKNEKVAWIEEPS